MKTLGKKTTKNKSSRFFGNRQFQHHFCTAGLQPRLPGGEGHQGPAFLDALADPVGFGGLAIGGDQGAALARGAGDYAQQLVLAAGLRGGWGVGFCPATQGTRQRLQGLAGDGGESRQGGRVGVVRLRPPQNPKDHAGGSERPDTKSHGAGHGGRGRPKA